MSEVPFPGEVDEVEAPKRKAKATGVAADVAKLFSLQAKAKKAYQEIDRVETRIINAVKAVRGDKLKLDDGRTVTLKDNYRDRNGDERNVAFKTTAIRRYEVEVE